MVVHMKAIAIAVLTMVGSPPQSNIVYGTECKPLMEQIVKSYGLNSYIKSWSNSSMKAANSTTKLTVTCSIAKD